MLKQFIIFSLFLLAVSTQLQFITNAISIVTSLFKTEETNQQNVEMDNLNDSSFRSLLQNIGQNIKNFDNKLDQCLLKNDKIKEINNVNIEQQKCQSVIDITQERDILQKQLKEIQEQLKNQQQANKLLRYNNDQLADQLQQNDSEIKLLKFQIHECKENNQKID